ncbi:hypothetical protein FKM82_002469 [Ascaphus truei]
MSEGKGDNEAFYEQLRLQQLYGESRAGGGPESHTFQDPSDGAVYEWDPDRKAWFPKITDDFLALYHANYGVDTESKDDSNPGESAENKQTPNAKPTKDKKPKEDGEPQSQPGEPKTKGEKRKPDPGWFHVEDQRNTNVYVAGLPPDVTNDEFVQIMSKCGIIMRDPVSEEYKIKLYKDRQGNLKGDGLCCYLKRESVDLALKLLDDHEIRGHKLRVENATFQLKGEYDATKKKKKCKDYRKKLTLQQKQLDWRPEKKASDTRKRFERVVIIRNMFHPSDFERHPDGVASVSFKDAEEGDNCIQALNGRWFGGRQLLVETWDGVTDYQIEETSREREERLKGWDNFLHTDGKSKKPEVGSDESATPADNPQPAEKKDDSAVSENNNDNHVHQAEEEKVDPTKDDAESTDSSIGSSDEEAEKDHL